MAAALREYLPELRRLHVGATGLARLPAEPVPLSYVAAAAVVVDLPDRQRLLAADDGEVRARGGGSPRDPSRRANARI